VTGANEVFGMPATGSDVTDASGDATFSYIGVFPGSDTITAFADFDDDGIRNPNPAAHEPQDTATKIWTLPASTVGNVRGGGWIVTDDGQRANFGFTFKMKSGAPGPSGRLTYLEHANIHLKVKSISIDALIVSGSSAKIFGTANVKGTGAVVFRIDVTDNGEPGRGQDLFQLRLSDGYDSAAQILRGGNIQVG
jgi:hypothetical protein